MTNLTRAASVLELERTFQQELATDRWAAAESAFALASRCRDEGDWAKSREWVQQCLQLLEGFPADSLEQVATTRTSVAGVALPNYLHDGVVRERFGDLA
jgi:hypothetical protein